MQLPETLATHIADFAQLFDRPTLVALDGRSSAGKSTLAQQLADILDAVVVEGDDFYSGGHVSEWEQTTPEERSLYCIDWRRQRSVLRRLKSRSEAIWYPYDWSAIEGRRMSTPETAKPKSIVILEGVYSARPELHQLLDLTVILNTVDDERQRRFETRPRLTAWTTDGDDRERWASIFGASEDHYFDKVMLPGRFDVEADTATSQMVVRRDS